MRLIPPVHLPEPTADQWSWQLLARCRGMPSSVFFPSEGLRGYSLASQESEAKQICARCPVRVRCESYAFESRESFGIWGGLTAADRAARRGRPPFRAWA